jgi:hypothetical protein
LNMLQKHQLEMLCHVTLSGPTESFLGMSTGDSAVAARLRGLIAPTVMHLQRSWAIMQHEPAGGTLSPERSSCHHL